MAQDPNEADSECHDYCECFSPLITDGWTVLTGLQVLAFAMGLSFGIGDYIEGGVLVFVIVLNVTIGFWQELGAEKRMDALRALSSPSAAVLRDGKTIVVSK